ncbi:MAG: hypothetical protein ACKOTB_13645 [Planctomycetia bacterium]
MPGNGRTPALGSDGRAMFGAPPKLGRWTLGRCIACGMLGRCIGIWGLA